MTKISWRAAGSAGRLSGKGQQRDRAAIVLGFAAGQKDRRRCGGIRRDIGTRRQAAGFTGEIGEGDLRRLLGERRLQATPGQGDGEDQRGGAAHYHPLLFPEPEKLVVTPGVPFDGGGPLGWK